MKMGEVYIEKKSGFVLKINENKSGSVQIRNETVAEF